MRRKILTNIIYFLIVQFCCAQVNLQINNGIMVETSGGTSIEISGDLFEVDQGYLNGIIKSGSRTSLTSFAGIKLSDGFAAEIQRTTGSEYTENSAGKNILRHYRVNNYGDSISQNVNISIRDREKIGLEGPFYLYVHSSDWQGYGNGSIDSVIFAEAINIKSGIVDLVISEGVGISMKIYLEAPYNSSFTSMRTTLNPYIPLNSPYAGNPRIALRIPENAVDWILIQLKEIENGMPIYSRAVFLNSDGFLIEEDGSIGIGMKVKPGDYYIVLRHRNHLSVMTKDIQTGLTWGSLMETYNFTDNIIKYFGKDGAKEIEPGIWGMWCGDTNNDDLIDESDKEAIDNTAVYDGYHVSDLNFDGTVTNADKYWVNINKITNPKTQVP